MTWLFPLNVYILIILFFTGKDKNYTAFRKILLQKSKKFILICGLKSFGFI